MILLFCILLFLLIFSKRLLGKNGRSSTGDGAIIMAAGIMLIGALKKFPFLAKVIGPYLVLVLLLLVLWLSSDYILDFLKGSFYIRHLQHPINSFSVGTWVAALSVTALSIITWLPAVKPLARFLFTLNCFLGVAYLSLLFRNYSYVFQKPGIIRKANGVVLLGCVASQSIVIAGNNLWVKFPSLVSLCLIILGILLYIGGILIIAGRYQYEKHEKILKNWPNTNTIIHGAISITGLATATSFPAYINLITSIWIFSFILLVCIEVTELRRAFLLIKMKGLKEGILTYQTTQWSRNFTIGMFFTFTAKLKLNGSFLRQNDFFHKVHHFIMSWGRYAVIVLFLIELGIAFIQHINSNKKLISK